MTHALKKSTWPFYDCISLQILALLTFPEVQNRLYRSLAASQPWDTWPGLAGFTKKTVVIEAESLAKGQSASKTDDTLLSTTPFAQMKWIQLSSHSLGIFRG